MEYSKKYRWALIGFIIMVLLNIGTLVTIWMIQPPRLGGVVFGEEQPRRVQRFLQRELSLTPEQLDAFQRLRREHMRETQSIITGLQETRSAYFELLNRPDSAVSTTARDSLEQRIGRAHARLEASTYRHFRELRDILDEEQRQRFNRVIDQTMQRRSRGRNRRQPGSVPNPGALQRWDLF